MDNLTVLSNVMFSRIEKMDLTLNDAIIYLKETARQRTVAEVLRRFIENPSMSDTELKRFLTERLRETLPDASPDSIRKNVSNWLKDTCYSVSKKNAIQLAFALGLSTQKADNMLMLLCREGLHRREKEDIIFCFALSNDLSYSDALRVIGKTNGLVSTKKKDERPFMLTSVAAQAIEQLYTEEELIEFLTDNIDSLDELHNTAYSFFSEFMKLLQTPDTNGFITVPNEKNKKAKPVEIDQRFSTKDVVEQYLYNNLIPRAAGKRTDKEQKKFLGSAMQRMIHQNWPDETVISRMITRDTDVSRKVLILLFLATDGGYTQYGSEDDPYADDTDLMSGAYGDYLDEISVEERFRETYLRMNSMLHDCGFAEIDPRNEFDWMVLYCMCSEDSFEIDEKMKQFLSTVFSEQSM